MAATLALAKFPATASFKVKQRLLLLLRLLRRRRQLQCHRSRRSRRSSVGSLCCTASRSRTTQWNILTPTPPQGVLTSDNFEAGGLGGWCGAPHPRLGSRSRSSRMHL